MVTHEAMTEELFRDDAYLDACEANVAGLNARGGVIIDRTVFYPTSGGQPGDTGRLVLDDGSEIAIALQEMRRRWRRRRR